MSKCGQLRLHLGRSRRLPKPGSTIWSNGRQRGLGEPRVLWPNRRRWFLNFLYFFGFLHDFCKIQYFVWKSWRKSRKIIKTWKLHFWIRWWHLCPDPNFQNHQTPDSASWLLLFTLPLLIVIHFNLIILQKISMCFKFCRCFKNIVTGSKWRRAAMYDPASAAELERPHEQR